MRDHIRQRKTRRKHFRQNLWPRRGTNAPHPVLATATTNQSLTGLPVTLSRKIFSAERKKVTMINAEQQRAQPPDVVFSWDLFLDIRKNGISNEDRRSDRSL